MKIIFYFLFCSLTMFSQNSGRVTYKVLMPENKKAIGTENERFFKDIKEKGDQRSYTLEFNDTQSHFFLNENMENETSDDTANKIVSVLIGHSNYYDSEKKASINQNLNGILLKDENPTKDWVITTESKLIDTHKCYKAEYAETYKSNGANKIRTITAWFAPSLPYSFGPKDYHGLPGLILELVASDKNIKFIVVNIQIEQKPLIIKFPKGKPITVDEYMSKTTSGVFYKK